uniref:Uncharacterized protein n=1 Tax=Knipowitschia caucasica TaxID=637954 RepID=A0AAV2J503_KNICA
MRLVVKLSVRELQALLLKKASGGRADKMAALLMRHMERQRGRTVTPATDNITMATGRGHNNVTMTTDHNNIVAIETAASVRERVIHTSRGQYTLRFSKDAQSPERPERLQVTFKPTVCRLRCTRGRCVNVCELANLTTVSSGAEEGAPFRVFVCPLLCQNGGLCLQKDRCACPPNFTGKFCQLNAMANHSAASPPFSANQQLTHSQFLLPLGDSPETHTAGAPGRPMVHVRVQHPPEASVEVHQVIKVPASQRAGVTAGSAGFPAPGSRGVQAQSVSGTGTFNHNSGFKYCFREVTAGQCSSPLPGLRSRDTCCRGGGRGWGIEDCTICTDKDSSHNCPTGYERVDGKCEAHRVISEEKGQCFRVVSSGSCSLPILRSITKQICCCSRVGKAWGPDCLRCPPFGSAAFKETCPAGPGYHYSASALQFTQRAIEQLGHRGAPLIPFNITHTGLSLDPDPVQTKPSPDAVQTKPSPDAVQTKPSPDAVQTKPSPDAIQTRPSPDAVQTRPSPPLIHTSPNRQNAPASPQIRPVPAQPEARRPSSHGSSPSSSTSGSTSRQGQQNPRQSQPLLGVSHTPEQTRSRPHSPVTTTTSKPRPRVTTTTTKPRLRIPVTIMTTRPPAVRDVDECADPSQCPGQMCLNSVGSYRCVSCRHGYRLLNRQCIDVDECRQAPCTNGRCENTPGSYRCVCHQGYRLLNNTCEDVDECADPSQCPGQMCLNSVGSYRCVSCRHGYRLLNRQCIDVDECEEKGACPGQMCINSEGSYSCVSCRHGYSLVGGVCTDVDECADPSQCPGQTCLNSVGSYRCMQQLKLRSAQHLRTGKQGCRARRSLGMNHGLRNDVHCEDEAAQPEEQHLFGT